MVLPAFRCFYLLGTVGILRHDSLFVPGLWRRHRRIRVFTGLLAIPEKVFEAVPLLHGVELPLVFVGIMTFILILSSVTMVLAVEAGHRMEKQAVVKWMLWTVIGGLTFLSCQAWEWGHFIHGTEAGGMLDDGTAIFGANLVHNQYGPPLFADLFFFITGFHGFHVFTESC